MGVLSWKPYQQHVVHSPWNSFLGRRFSEGVIIIINMMMTTPKHNLSFWGAPKMRYCVLRIQAWPDGCHLCGEKQTLSPLICVFVCRARIAANIPSKRQQASKTPAHRT